MKKAIFITTILAGALQTWAADNNESVQLRLTRQSPGKYTEQMEIIHHDQSAALKEMLFVEDRSLVDQSQIRSAELGIAIDGAPRIDLLVNSAGDRSFERSLRRDAGRRLAVVVDGQALAAGEITQPSIPGKIELSGDFSKDEAQRIVDRINQATRHQ